MELSGAVEHQSYVTSDRRMPLSASDESLLQASANGDQRAFSELYERHARTIYNYLFRAVGGLLVTPALGIGSRLLDLIESAPPRAARGSGSCLVARWGADRLLEPA
jgi:hypothetical protein